MTLELNMSLAEALLERKARQERLQNLTQRLAVNARVQEGDVPAEDPATLLAEAGQAVADLEQLIVAINWTNGATRLPGDEGMTIMEAIARRDMLGLRLATLQSTIEAATKTRERWAVTRNEVRTRATVDVAALQREHDDLARTRRELDARLQAANWATALLPMQTT